MVQDSNGLYYMQLSTDHMNMTKWLTNEQRGLLFKLVFMYFCEEMTEQEIINSIPSEHSIILPIWSDIQLSIERSKTAYSERCRINKENGKKGGAPKGNQNERKKASYTDDEDEEEAEDYSWLENMSDEEVKNFFKAENQNCGLAYQYQCFSTELQNNGYHISELFNWQQFVDFMNYYATFMVFCCNSIELFFMCFQDESNENGFNGFINKINESVTGLIDYTKSLIFEIDKQTIIACGDIDEAEQRAKEFTETLNYSKGIETMLLDIAETDEELQLLANNR